MSNITFESQLKKYELDIPNNWRGDFRNTLIDMFSPLVSGTEYSFKLNKGESRPVYILELHHEGHNGRVIGIKALQREMKMWIFFNPDLYKRVKQRIDIPDNMQPNRSQPHIKVSLETVWNILCVVTNKEEYRTDKNVFSLGNIVKFEKKHNEINERAKLLAMGRIEIYTCDACGEDIEVVDGIKPERCPGCDREIDWE